MHGFRATEYHLTLLPVVLYVSPGVKGHISFTEFSLKVYVFLHKNELYGNQHFRQSAWPTQFIVTL